MSVKQLWYSFLEQLGIGRRLDSPEAEVNHAIRTDWNSTEAAIFAFGTEGMDRDGYDAQIAEVVSQARKIEPKVPRRLTEEYVESYREMAVVNDCVWVHEPYGPWQLDVVLSEKLWDAQEGKGFFLFRGGSECP